LKNILIDENVFVPQDEIKMRKYFKIPSEKRFVIYARYEKGMGRAKGYDHMTNILNKCYDKMTEQERRESIFVMAGSVDDDYAATIRMDTQFLGFLPLDRFVKSYPAASVFISTSVDDAGPSMVNQSMMCGTPVVTFSIGTALQVTQEGVNGYMVANFDDEAFADRILQIARMRTDDFCVMRKATRASALSMNSRRANAKRLIEIYEETRKLKREQ
jgi:glycosyltransferase involved in cell wall biosynthesis